jgi:nucleoid-associated protein YgaU
LGCTFQEWRSGQDDALLENTQSADVTKTRRVKLGDTLSSIAGEEYNDPAMWRPIAEANGIDDPRSLTPGTVLAVPALAPPRSLRS